MDELEKTISEIAKKSGKSEKEIMKLVDAKVKKFEGLLTEQGAIFMVQKELGLKSEEKEEIKISELNDGMKDVEIKGIVKTIYPIKEFEKNGKNGKVGSFLVEDDTGIVRITLWNDQIEKYDLTIGSEVRIVDGFVSSYNEKKQLSLGYNGKIEVLNKKEELFEKISELKAGMQNVNLVGRMIRKFPCKEFESGERKGKLCSFQFGDETALLRATAWNEKADEIQKYNEGDVVEIKNAYTKNGLAGIEVNLGYSAQIKESDKKMPSIIEILKESVNEKKINELMENENVIINGKVEEIQKGNVYFLACEKCGKKVSNEGKAICENCGEVKGEKRAVLSAIIEDDTGKIRTNFFGKNALNLINWKQSDLEKNSEGKSSEKIIEEINEKIKGKKIKLFGYERVNSYSGDNEFSVKEIVN